MIAAAAVAVVALIGGALLFGVQGRVDRLPRRHAPAPAAAAVPEVVEDSRS